MLDILAQIETKIKELGWSISVVQTYMNTMYGKQSPKDLSDEELLDLLRNLTTYQSEYSDQTQANFVKDSEH
ncbi:MAG: hypothetical protein JGK30_16405 [Microcoleus sp. PH2017_40_RAT_O_B]|nr:hypothetical protein [Microcoleus sp. PH2017_05_CCC_O_A]MCC3437963.1 hypothetical protein [Microcoleus sp. PH2017_05_CCC_O_A]MCC3573514.1 hypothetical protein [Microcoleus sp. PH2017_34_RAT_O_A]MCC3611044.1 hypothetical protein [Microcoleus sp. PH2017_40_RAT_O_B]